MPVSTASHWPQVCTLVRSGLIEDHPRFRDAKLGIIVSRRCVPCKSSSRRVLAPIVCPISLWLKARWLAATLVLAWTGRNMIWQRLLLTCMQYSEERTAQYSRSFQPAVSFTGSDATGFLEAGAAAVQVATRFTVARECGLPDLMCKQHYFTATEGRYRS
jgi:nitronate monooxygenase